MPDSLYFYSVQILTPTRILEKSSVLIREGRIDSIGPEEATARQLGARQVNGAGLTLAPGFMDLQINGAFGEDFTETPESIWRVGSQLGRYGVTAFLPTIISSPPEAVAAAQAVIQKGPPPGYRGAKPLGLHMEGPFLNPEKRGAHNPACLRDPSMKMVEGWSPQAGVRMVTLAPELPGALEVIQALASRGVVVSAGHSMATYEQAREGFEAGIKSGTHLFNAMPPLGHRKPGLAGALLEDERLEVGMIVDGIHVHPAMVKLAFRAKGAKGFYLVSDAMAALGMPPGAYRLGDFDIQVDERAARLANGTLAGSLLSPEQALINLMDFAGCSLAEALPCLTTTPATLIGERRKGAIAPGYDADLVLLKASGGVAASLAAGEFIYEK